MIFSSDSVPAALRREAVEAAFGAHVRGQVDFARDVPVQIEIGLRPLASVHLARVTSSPLSLVTPAEDDGLLYVSFTHAGGGVIDAQGSVRRVRPGDFNVMLRNRQCMTVLDAASSVVSLALPRLLVEPRLTDVDRLDDPGRAASGPARLLANYAAALVASGDLDLDVQATVAGHLADLVVLTLGARRDDAQAASVGGLRAARRRAVKADMVAHLTDPRVDVDWAARRHGVSSATIRALFYDEGTSFSDYLRSVRLDHARTLLLAPFTANETVTSIALTAGFNDIGWFNQAFRRRFGMTPSQMRVEGRARSDTSR